tara:strand:+ start:1794 stop:2234 length:441 start_codon:yes stop_codon:yes gene_type:complete
MTNLAIPTNTFPSLLGRNVFDDFFGALSADIPSLVRRTTQGYPVADIYTDNTGNTVMEFALAGFSRGDLNVEVKPEDNTITVSAQATLEEGETDSRRIARRSFQKTYVNYNNKLDLTAVAATYENGLLTVTLPQSAEVAPLAIEIQ